MAIIARYINAALSLGLTAALFIPRASAAESSPDTSGWACAQCPFSQGYQGDVELGALQARAMVATRE
jgi:hypothetical protein